MAHGLKYYYDFYWDHNSSNNDYRVGFYFDGYASTSTALTAGKTPLVITVKGQKDSIDHPILGSEAQMEIHVNKSDVDTFDGDFLASDYKDIIVKVIQDPTGTPVIKWVGILTPQNCDREYLGYKFVYSLSAVDGLADLKNQYYTVNGKDYGSVYNGFEDMLTIFKTALSKVADISDLQLDFRIQLGTYSNLMTSTQNAYKESEVAQEIFYKVTDDGNEPDTCYDVIEKLLKPFYCVMAQVDGYYQIWCLSERSSYYFEYDWSTLTEQSRTSRNRTVTWQGAITGYETIGRGSLSKIPPIRSFTALLYNKEYATELLTNGSFDSNITGWSNGDAATSMNTFNTLAWYNYPSIGGTLGAAWSGSATAGTYSFRTTSTISLDASGENINVTFLAEQNSFTHSGSAYNLVRARLYNATDGYVDGSFGQRPFYGTGFQNFQETFSTSGLTVDNNYLEIEIEVQDSTTTAFQFYFDYITLSQVQNNAPLDWKKSGLISSGTQYEDKETIIYIADRQESDSDSCSIKDSGGSYTSTWDRYNDSDTLPLTSILIQQQINANATFKDYVRCTAYDPDETIDIFSLMYSNELNLPVRYSDIIGMTKDYREATIRLDLKQNGAEVSDVSINYYSNKLATQYGESL